MRGHGEDQSHQPLLGTQSWVFGKRPYFLQTRHELGTRRRRNGTNGGAPPVVAQVWDPASSRTRRGLSTSGMGRAWRADPQRPESTPAPAVRNGCQRKSGGVSFTAFDDRRPRPRARCAVRFAGESAFTGPNARSDAKTHFAARPGHGWRVPPGMERGSAAARDARLGRVQPSERYDPTCDPASACFEASVADPGCDPTSGACAVDSSSCAPAGIPDGSGDVTDDSGDGTTDSNSGIAGTGLHTLCSPIPGGVACIHQSTAP